MRNLWTTIAGWWDRLMAHKAASRPMWTEEPLEMICAWHEDLTHPRNAHATHGICDACRVKFEGAAA